MRWQFRPDRELRLHDAKVDLALLAFGEHDPLADLNDAIFTDRDQIYPARYYFLFPTTSKLTSRLHATECR